MMISKKRKNRKNKNILGTYTLFSLPRTRFSPELEEEPITSNLSYSSRSSLTHSGFLFGFVYPVDDDDDGETASAGTPPT